jgi:CubicO group peptidase (beta-lactamase class C family)
VSPSGLAPDGDTVLSPPGRRRIYSNRGIEVAAELVSRRTGADFGVLLRERVLDPLGMSGTVLSGSPAHGARGPVRDLAVLGRELLSPTLVPALMADATRPAFAGLAGVLPGFGRQDPNGKSPHWTGTRNSAATFGHFGQSGSFLWVDPAAKLACAALADTPFGEWAVQAWPELSDAVLAEFAP